MYLWLCLGVCPCAKWGAHPFSASNRSSRRSHEITHAYRSTVIPQRVSRSCVLFPKMPTAASSRRRENLNANNTVLSDEESLAQLQQAVQHNDHQQRADASQINTSDGSNTNNAARGGGTASAAYTDGARKPIIAGADYSSLRLLTRRQPKDPEHVLEGLDTSNMDLSWTAREESSNLDPNGQPWRYPKRRGKGEGSNLDQFKDEITERTKNGEGCKAIAEAFIAMGVDTSVRAVARQRMKWGLRQRASLIEPSPGQPSCSHVGVLTKSLVRHRPRER